MLKGSCHCGAVRFELAERPQFLSECNCTLCRRIGALWAHAEIEKITIDCEPGATIRYIQGDRLLAVHTCRTCGSTTHWENLRPEDLNRMAVNCRMVEPQAIAGIPVRLLDGAADTWEVLD